MMIQEIILKDYRCFHNSKLKFKNLTIIVGKNNAGKTSLIEALRMTAYASRKALGNSFKEPPYGFDIPIRDRGIFIDTNKLKIDLRGIVHMYSESIASATVLFDNGCKIFILCNNEVAFARLYGVDGEIIKNKVKAEINGYGCVGILPQIGLIKENEILLSKDTVNADKETYLSSKHFRNELWLYKNQFFSTFRKMAEASWDGLKIEELSYNMTDSEYIRLMVKDGIFPGELGIMGSGLQMWLQIIWFFSKSGGNDTIILDEPDVYMHPDLQTKLLFLAKRLYKQVIIATHSVEIISAVAPGNIVMIDKDKRSMNYANRLGAVQEIVDNIGGVQNLSLIRLGTRKKILFCEGEDNKILSKIFVSLFPEKENTISTLPYVQLKGFTNLREAYGAAKLLDSETNGGIKACCLLDSDYYPESYLQEKLEEAKNNKLELHIWKKKEIENYVIIPKVIFRILGEKRDKYKIFLEELEILVEQHKEDETYKLADVLGGRNREWSAGVVYRTAKEYIESRWNSLEEKLSLVSGKEMLKDVNKWCKERYKKSVTLHKIIEAMTIEDCSQELLDVLDWLK